MSLISFSLLFVNTHTLTQAVLEAWREIGQDAEFLQALTVSVPRRWDAVLAANGEPTKY